MGIKAMVIKAAVNWIKPYIKRELSVEKIAGYACEGIEWAADKSLGNIPDERLEAISKGCNLGASVLGNIAAAVDPTSSGGRGITEAERVPIRANLVECINLVVTQEQVDSLVDSVCGKVVERLA